MSMKECKECKKEVSTSAKTCPHCGVKSPTTTAGDNLGAIFLIVLIVFGGVWYFSGDDSPEQVTQQEQQHDKPAKKETEATGFTGKGKKLAEERQRALNTQGGIAVQSSIVDRMTSKNEIIMQVERSWQSGKFATVALLYDKHIAIGNDEINTPNNAFEFYIQGINETDLNLDSLVVYLGSLFCVRRFLDYRAVLFVTRANYDSDPVVVDAIDGMARKIQSLKDSYLIAMAKFPSKEAEIVLVLETACSNMDLSK